MPKWHIKLTRTAPSDTRIHVQGLLRATLCWPTGSLRWGQAIAYAASGLRFGLPRAGTEPTGWLEPWPFLFALSVASQMDSDAGLASDACSCTSPNPHTSKSTCKCPLCAGDWQGWGSCARRPRASLCSRGQSWWRTFQVDSSATTSLKVLTGSRGQWDSRDSHCTKICRAFRRVCPLTSGPHVQAWLSWSEKGLLIPGLGRRFDST